MSREHGPKRFTVHMKKWVRGMGAEVSKLRTRWDGKMCCLGFHALACGFTEEEITGEASPGNLHRKFSYTTRVPAWLLPKRVRNQDSALGERLMNTNDNMRITDAERIKRIKKLFKTVGVEVIFKD